MRPHLSPVRAVLAALGFAILHCAPAQAAEPQILGLVAGVDALPMACDDRVCGVELSSFCMQERAPVPPPHTPYRLAEASLDAVVIVARTAAGRTVRLPAAQIADFASQRGNRAVRMSVPQSALRGLGLTDVAVEVGPLASVVPDSLIRSDDPAVRSEIAMVTGPLRVVADRLIDRGGPGTVAALITNRLINEIPEASGGDVEDRQALWHKVVGAVTPDRAAGLHLAEDAFRRCAGLPGGGFISFRECLAARHDILLSPQNRAYWDAVEGGI